MKKSGKINFETFLKNWNNYHNELNKCHELFINANKVYLANDYILYEYAETRPDRKLIDEAIRSHLVLLHEAISKKEELHSRLDQLKVFANKAKDKKLLDETQSIVFGFYRIFRLAEINCHNYLASDYLSFYTHYGVPTEETSARKRNERNKQLHVVYEQLVSCWEKILAAQTDTYAAVDFSTPDFNPLIESIANNQNNILSFGWIEGYSTSKNGKLRKYYNRTIDQTEENAYKCSLQSFIKDFSKHFEKDENPNLIWEEARIMAQVIYDIAMQPELLLEDKEKLLPLLTTVINHYTCTYKLVSPNDRRAMARYWLEVSAVMASMHQLLDTEGSNYFKMELVELLQKFHSNPDQNKSNEKYTFKFIFYQEKLKKYSLNQQKLDEQRVVEAAKKPIELEISTSTINKLAEQDNIQAIFSDKLKKFHEQLDAALKYCQRYNALGKLAAEVDGSCALIRLAKDESTIEFSDFDCLEMDFNQYQASFSSKVVQDFQLIKDELLLYKEAFCFMRTLLVTQHLKYLMSSRKEKECIKNKDPSIISDNALLVPACHILQSEAWLFYQQNYNVFSKESKKNITDQFVLNQSILLGFFNYRFDKDHLKIDHIHFLSDIKQLIMTFEASSVKQDDEAKATSRWIISMALFYWLEALTKNHDFQNKQNELLYCSNIIVANFEQNITYYLAKFQNEPSNKTIFEQHLNELTLDINYFLTFFFHAHRITYSGKIRDFEKQKQALNLISLIIRIVKKLSENSYGYYANFILPYELKLIDEKRRLENLRFLESSQEKLKNGIEYVKEKILHDYETYFNNILNAYYKDEEKKVIISSRYDDEDEQDFNDTDRATEDENLVLKEITFFNKPKKVRKHFSLNELENNLEVTLKNKDQLAIISAHLDLATAYFNQSKNRSFYLRKKGVGDALAPMQKMREHCSEACHISLRLQKDVENEEKLNEINLFILDLQKKTEQWLDENQKLLARLKESGRQAKNYIIKTYGFKAWRTENPKGVSVFTRFRESIQLTMDLLKDTNNCFVATSNTSTEQTSTEQTNTEKTNNKEISSKFNPMFFGSPSELIAKNRGHQRGSSWDNSYGWITSPELKESALKSYGRDHYRLHPSLMESDQEKWIPMCGNRS